MNKNYVVILMLVLCVICVGCGNKNEIQEPSNNSLSVNSGDIEVNENKDTIEIIEGTEKIVVNMYDDSTTEYILSGDLVVDKIDIYHFESKEKAESFASTLDESKMVTVENSDVIVQSNENLNLTKKDLLKTYKNLKEEYEYEL